LLLLAGRRVEPQDRIQPRLYPSDADEGAVDALLASYDYQGEPLVAVAPGSVWATKRWPYFGALATQLATTGRLVVIGGPDDRAVADEVLGAAPADTIDAAGKLGLLASAALLRRCRVLVTNDSAPLHLASAMNTPTVALFGPRVPAFGFSPLASRALTGEIDLACRPCHHHGLMTCPLGHHRCMRDLPVPVVRDLAERLSA
jgi:heptosyltransferase II